MLFGPLGSSALGDDGSVSAAPPAEDRTYDITILALPSSQQPITDLQYRANGGAWQSLGGSTTGVYQAVIQVGASVQIRAVSSAGDGSPSDTKVAA